MSMVHKLNVGVNQANTDFFFRCCWVMRAVCVAGGYWDVHGGYPFEILYTDSEDLWAGCPMLPVSRLVSDGNKEMEGVCVYYGRDLSISS